MAQELEISSEFLNTLEKADKKLKKLNETTDQLESTFSSLVNGGLTAFSQKLGEITNAIGNISKAKIGDLGIEKVANDATKAADAVNTVVEAVDKLASDRGKFSGKVKNARKQNESAKKSIADYIADNNAFEKYQRDRVKLLDQLAQKQDAEEQAQSRRAKQKSQEAAQSYEAQYRAWEKMFDEIEQKEAEKKAKDKAEKDKANADDIKRARQRYADLLAEQERLTKEVNRGFELKSKYGPSDVLDTAHEAVKDEWSKVYQEKVALEQKYQGHLTDIQEKAESERNKKSLDGAEKLAKRKAELQAKAEKDAAQQLYQKRTSYEGALEFSRTSKTIQDQITAIKYLTEARKNLEKTGGKKGDKEYRDKMMELTGEIKRQQAEIDKLTGKHQQLSNAHRGVMNTGEQLKRALTGMFSVSAISRYVKKLTQVRGEFELQQRALQAILQNKDEADKLWDKTVQLAIKSPFQIKELVTYTKQLAAYRIELDKLYDTNKMLADISAGLGVDMQRLILAFGQVKAANYLRGTELRQFSEAGINILGELAKYFTELEGRAVSVGDVFERVSKRMVSFADVEEVLKRVTSEGGVFYNMQEIQAETLKGQISNLKDSIDVMLNEIGKGNEGVLKGVVKLTKSLVDNWRSIADYSIPVLTAMALKWAVVDGRIAKVVGSMGGLTKNLKVVYAHLTRGTAVAKRFASALGTSVFGVWGTIATVAVAAIGAIIVKLTEASREAKRLQKELDNIANEDKSNLNKSVRTFEDLVRRLATVNVGSQEHSDIISKLNSQYGEYLGFLVDEKTTYDQLAGSINNVVSAMTQKAKANTIEKQYNIVYDAETAKQNTYLQSLKKISASGNLVNEKGEPVIVKDKEFEEIISLFKERVEQDGKGGLPEFLEILSTYYKQQVRFFSGQYYSAADAFYDELMPLAQSFIKLQQAEDKLYADLAALYGESESTREYREAMDKFMREVPQRQQYWANELFPTYDKDGKKINTNLGKLAENQLEAIQREIEQERLTIKYTYELQPSGGSVANAVNEAMKDWDSRQDVVKRANAQLAKVLGGKDKSILDAVYQERATAGQKNIGQIIDEYVAGYKGAEEELKRLNDLKKEGAVYSQKQTDEWQEQVNQQKELMNAYKEGLKAYGALDQLPENQKEFSDFKKRISLIEEMRKKYEELRKSYSAETSIAGVIRDYGEAWEAVGGQSGEISTIGLDSLEDTAIYIEQVLMPLIEELPKKYQKEAKQIATKSAAGLRVLFGLDEKKISDKDLQKEISNLFDNYEFSLELKKLHVPASLAKQLFGLETIDLKTLRKKLEAMSPQFVGTDMEEEYKKWLEKVQNMEDESREERIKKYVQYLATAQSQRVKIEMDSLRQIKEVNEEANFSDAQKATIIAKIRQDAQKEIDKVQWEDFKNSEFYTLMFEDLESLGDQSIDLLRKQLEDLRGSLSHLDATEVNEIMSQLQKLKDLEIKRDPFGALRTSREEINRLKSKGITQESLALDLSTNELMLSIAKEEYDLLQMALSAKQKGLVLDGEAAILAEQGIVWLENRIKEQDEYIEGLNDEQKIITGNLQKYRNYYNSVQGSMERTKDYLDQTNNILSGTVALMDALGVPAEDSSRFIADMGMNLVSAAQSAIQFEQQMQAVGYASNMALGVIGWIAIGIQTIASLIQTIANYNQGRLNAQIESYQKNIDDLQKSYDKLEKSMDEAFNIEQLQKYNQEMKNNLQLQLDNAKAAKAAADAGKDNKENQEKSEQYQDIIDEITESMDELDKSTKEAFSGGAFDSILSDAEAFVDAWLGAFEETGDGLSGLEEQFQDTLKNIVKRQVALQFVGNYVKGWSDTLNSMFASDGELTPEEISEYAEKIKSEFPELSERLEEFFKALGSTLDGTGSLSGLEKGIQGITEATAEVIASFLNSLRFYVADTNSRVTNVERLISGDEKTNPMLEQLKIIAAQTEAIHNLLRSVATPDGNYIKVELKES